jgi:hypothetical protein
LRRSLLLFDPQNKPTNHFARFMREMQIPGDSLSAIDEALQKRFFQKGSDNQPLERWDLHAVEVSCPHDRFVRHLQLCGFGMETIPSEWEYDRAVWPGALLVRAVYRLFDLRSVWASGVRWRETIVLAGKRPIIPERETPDDAHNLLTSRVPMGGSSFQDFGVNTELEMMQWLLRYINASEGFRETFVFVDAPMKPPAFDGGQPVRPTTEDTVGVWLETNPLPGSLLLSSGAPYGMAQDEALWMFLESHGHTVETFGHEAPDLSMEVFMREVAGAVNRIRRARGL